MGLTRWHQRWEEWVECLGWEEWVECLVEWEEEQELVLELELPLLLLQELLNHLLQPMIWIKNALFTVLAGFRVSNSSIHALLINKPSSYSREIVNLLFYRKK